MRASPTPPRFPGRRMAVDGNTAVILVEREASDAAGAYPITPSTQMGEYWAEAAAKGHLNISERPLIFIEPEGEHAAAAVTAGLAMTGLRSANFSSGQGIAYMHESLYAAVGKRLTYVLNIGARAMTKATLNVHAGHDDYHCIDDTGFFQLFARDAQAAADLNLIAHRTAELALNPGIVAQDGFLTTHLIESIQVPERELVAEYLGLPDDVIDTPTPAQKILYGPTRRRIPILWDVDNPMMAGLVQNQDSYMQSVASQRPFFFDHIRELTDRAMDEYGALTGRPYSRVMTYEMDDAEWVILGQGSMIPSAHVVADWLRAHRKLKVGVVDLVMFRPFPGDLLSRVLAGRKGVAVLERLDQPLAADLPLVREVRSTVARCLENGRTKGALPHAGLQPWSEKEAPAIYSGSFGMGSRDLQPEGLIAAVENMLPDGPRKPFFYLSIDFLRDEALTPKQALHQEEIEDAYPGIRELAIRGSENPNLMPEGSVAVRFHSIGGWGAITTGKNLAMTLFDLLGLHIKANPKYGSEKKGQPTTFYLSAAPEPIRVNCEYHYVDVVLSPDPNVFGHTNAIAGLREGGVFILQTDQTTPEKVWSQVPPAFRKTIVDKKIRFFGIDAFKIAREEATDPDLQLRMQGIAFQGAFFAASGIMERHGLDEKRLLDAIGDQVQKKFGSKGARVVEENMRVVKRGFDELIRVDASTVPAGGDAAAPASVEPPMPEMVRSLPASSDRVSDVHRFWEQTGSFYARGMGNDTLTDPFVGLGVMPATTALFRDMTGIRFEHPEWIPENCTACGSCYTVCPDTAIPGLVSEPGAVLDTALRKVRQAGHDAKFLPKAVRKIEQVWKADLEGAQPGDSVPEMLAAAIDRVESDGLGEGENGQLATELDWLREAVDGFQLAVTRPYHTVHEQQQKGSGGLLSITVDPYTCKGCMECVQVCEDDALRPKTQTSETIARLKKDWSFWLDLPTTPEKYVRIDDLEEGIGALETLLLDKEAYLAFTSGDGACLGCSEKTIVHLFTATVESLMQPRIRRYVERIDDLIARLRRHVQLKLTEDLDLSDSAALARLSSRGGDLRLGDLAEEVGAEAGGKPLDREWLQRIGGLIAKLENLRWRYTEGTTGRGRTKMGMLNSTGCTSVWGSTWPYNPYPFPWANHLFQDSPSMAMGVFEGHMAKMADGFKAVRQAEAELDGTWDPRADGDRMKYFTWESFTDEEWELCPPVVVLGGDGAMYDIGFQNLSRAMMSGKPLKVVVVDTQVYSNTGGQACTSGFLGQVSDMAQFGKVWKGKPEVRKEIGLVGAAHRTTYVLQSTIAYPSHMIEGFIQGLKARRPALFNLYTSCQPEHGIGDDMSARQAKLVVESRAYPLFSYDPGRGTLFEECFELDGNPDIDADWPTYSLKYRDGGRERTLEVPMTFADFAITEVRFRKHFRQVPPDAWHDDMVPLHEFLALEPDDREGLYPFIWAVDARSRLQRLLVDATMVASCEDRLAFWKQLRALAGIRPAEGETPEQMEERIRGEVVGRIASGLMQMAGGSGGGLAALAAPSAPASTPGASAENGNGAAAAAGDGMSAWIDTENCTSCDECVTINPKIFAYDDRKKAFVKDPDGGPFKDIVKAAERCTARVIHPGSPRDASEKGLDKLVARAEKYN